MIKSLNKGSMLMDTIHSTAGIAFRAQTKLSTVIGYVHAESIKHIDISAEYKDDSITIEIAYNDAKIVCPYTCIQDIECLLEAIL
jgi:molybdenum cofactor biosynthesis enzyme